MVLIGHDGLATYYEAAVHCPACGVVMDYCQGHGSIGDPQGFQVLLRHDNGDHRYCHPDGCERGRA